MASQARELADKSIAPPGRRNLIINGAMTVAQRGTQTGHSSGYTLDRWNLYTNSAARFTVSQDSDVPSGQGFANSIKLDVTTADSSVAAGDYGAFRTLLEGQDLQHIRKGTSNAKELTLQFWIKSTVTGTYALELYDADNTRQVTKNYTVNSADTWEKKTITFPADTTGAFDDDNAVSLYIQFGFIQGSNFTSGTASGSWAGVTTANRYVGQVNAVNSTANNIYLTGVQLEVGSTATEFEHRSYGEELALCQRYYYEVDSKGIGGNYPAFMAFRYKSATNTYTGVLNHPIYMRTGPTVTFQTGMRVHLPGRVISAGTFAANLADERSVSISIFPTANWSDIIAAYPDGDGSNTKKIYVDAEL